MSVVLTPIDGSELALRAVPWAAKLAGRKGTVILLRVIPARPSYAEALLGITGDGEDAVKRIEDAWTEASQADIDEAAALIAESGVTIERLIAEGEPDEAIEEAVGKKNVDLIAMASHGRGAVGRAIFGSVADRVARASTVPVLILRRDEDKEAVRVNRIVVPLDGSELAARALPLAREIARELGVPVHIVRAVDPVVSVPVAPGVFGPTPVVSADLTDKIWQEAEAEARRTVEEASAQLTADGVQATGGVLQGSPFFAISEATRPGDLIILTSHGRGGVRRWLLGSVAEKLVREAPAPVILVPAPERASVNEGDRVMG